VVTASGDQTLPAAAGGNTNGAYMLAWQDGRSGSEAIYTRLFAPTAATTVIEYEYDGLCRLTGANYSTGERLQYAYDAVGNRTTMTTTAGATLYQYDAANRLTAVDGITLTWDNNGNLLEDHTGMMYNYG